MDNTNQIERIVRMERNLDEAAQAVAALSDAMERYRAVLPQIRELADYMDSGAWLRDYDDDCAGKLPSQLKRGVLSEDALYNLLADVHQLQAFMKTL